MKRLNKKGFTLIELLAVIIILGVLMIIAIPSVTTYIQNSRKSAWADTGVAYAKAVVTKVNEGGKLQFFTTRTMYLVPVGHTKGTACVSVESGGQSPFSDTWAYAYVGVLYNGSGYQYYYIAEDGAGQGIDFVSQQFLNKDGADFMYTKSAIPKGNETKDGHNVLADTYSMRAGEKYTEGNVEKTRPTYMEYSANSNATDFGKLFTKSGSGQDATYSGVLAVSQNHLVDKEEIPEFDTVIIVLAPNNEDEPCQYKVNTP